MPEFARRSARFLEQLPYSEELVRVFVSIGWAEGNDGNMEATEHWYALLERKAKANHDLNALIIGRTFYLGEFPEGAAIRFESFYLQQKNERAARK